MTVMNGNMPMVVQSQLLPAPQVRNSPHPPAEAVDAIVGAKLAEPLALLEQLIAEAKDAVVNLEVCRPGVAGPDGAKWKDALVSDIEDVDGGERPKRYRLEGLIAGEPHRWAKAKALAGSIDVMLQRVTATLDTRKIATVAKSVESARASEWASAARAGWQVRTDRAAAWGHVRTSESALAAYVAAKSVRKWAEGGGWGMRSDRHAQVPYVDHLPVDKVARGHYLATRLALNADETWLSIPADVKFPEGSEPLIDRAFPELGARFVALREQGVYAERR